MLAIATSTSDISLLWSIPFVLLLACIALMPFVAKHWWERHYPKVSLGLALLVALHYFGVRHAPGPWLHEMREYVSFIVLLAALYVVSGGIAIRVNRLATPAANAVLLLIGAVIANVFGTTGAAMLLIRPYLRMNRGHVRPYHVVFFIFVVANAGGSLTPIGDPPLFLGYLKGVPFGWTLEHMLGPWLLVVGALVTVFFLIDTLEHRKLPREHAGDPGPQVHILGVHNFLFIAVVVLAVFRPSAFDAGGVVEALISREVLMAAAAIASRKLTAASLYSANEFTFGPIKEVAILFVGIFSTMVPALQWLGQNAHRLDVRTPGQFYFASGGLSSVLDNAPTYLTFLQLRLAELDKGDVQQVAEVVGGMKGQQGLLAPDLSGLRTAEAKAAVAAMVRYHEDDVRRGTVTRDQVEVAFLIGTPAWNLFVVAVSAGSVFFGACTYIGNGPNFMVKSIADASGVRTPGFLEYVWRYALPILIPLYVVVWLVCFARAGGS